MDSRNGKQIFSGAIAILGSGETSPNLVSVHREMISRLKKITNPLIINSPFGFQENVDELSDKLQDFFMKSLGIETDILSYRTPDDLNTVDYFKCLDKINKSNFVFAGPGSPSYAIKIWKDTGFPKSFKEVLQNNGSLVFSSAAATTLGEYTLPVYEIYKVGEKPYWIEGLDILSAIGIKATVIPHFNNKEGGNHDTRFCYMGESRFEILRNKIDSNIIGIDEHTGLVIDGKSLTGKIFGIGKVTILWGENYRNYIPGETIYFEEFASLEMNKVVPLKVDKENIEQNRNIDKVSDIISKSDINQESINKILSEIKINLEDLEDKTRIIDPLINLIMEVRKTLRAEEVFELSDYIRDELKKLGIEINDNDVGATWRFKA